MAVAPHISISQELSPRLALMLAVQFGGGFMEQFGTANPKDGLTTDESTIINTFRSGLGQQRLEIHGMGTAAPIGTLMAHLMDSADPGVIEMMCAETLAHGSPEQVAAWKGIGAPLDIASLEHEANELVKLLEIPCRDVNEFLEHPYPLPKPGTDRNGQPI